MTVYAESSAVLSWVLGEAAGASAHAALREASVVVTADLTLIECERALIRAAAVGEMSEVDATDRRGVLRSAARHWTTLPLDEDVLDRARRPFPGEPIRTLDAIHLATFLVGRLAVPDLTLLSLDRRMRENAAALGVEVRPA